MKLDARPLGPWKLLVPDQARLDAYVSEEFKQLLVESIADGTRDLLLDLSGVEFMDSSGLGAIVYCLQRLEKDGRIAIAGPQESVSLMLRLTHMDKIFTVVKKPENVLQEAN